MRNRLVHIHHSSFIIPHSLLMRSRLTPLLKLFYNPLHGMTEISAPPPYLTGAMLAVLATFFYYELLSGNLQFMFTAFSQERSMGVIAPIERSCENAVN